MGRIQVVCDPLRARALPANPVKPACAGYEISCPRPFQQADSQRNVGRKTYNCELTISAIRPTVCRPRPKETNHVLVETLAIEAREIGSCRRIPAYDRCPARGAECERRGLDQAVHGHH